MFICPFGHQVKESFERYYGEKKIIWCPRCWKFFEIQAFSQKTLGGKIMPKEWKEVTGKVVTLGNGENQVKEVEGTLVAIEPSSVYPKQVNYILEHNKERITVFGTAFMRNRIDNTMIGKEIKLVFKGMTPTKSGRDAKDIQVLVRGWAM